MLQTTPWTAFENRSAGLTKRSLQPHGLFSAFFSSQQLFSLLTASAILFRYTLAPIVLLTAAHLSPLFTPTTFFEDLLESKPHPYTPLIVRASTTAAVMVLHYFLIKWSWRSYEPKCSSDVPICRCADYLTKLILHMFEISSPWLCHIHLKTVNYSL